MREVVITGIGLTTPLGDRPDDVVERCHAGRAGFARISLYETAGSPVRFAGEHSTPDARQLPDRKSAKILSRRDQAAVLTAQAAFRAAGLDLGVYPSERLGMFVGASCTHLGDLTPSLPLVAKHADLVRGAFDSAGFGREFMETFNPIVVLSLLMNNALCFATIGLAIKGVNSNYMQHEVSGLRALGEGYLAVASGRADAVLAGGTAQPVEAFQMHEALHLGLLADQTQPGFDPAQAVRPYDRSGVGTVLSEASAFFVLEDGSRARQRGAKIHGRILGYGMAADGAPDEGPDGRMAQGPSGGLLAALRVATADPRAAGKVIGAVYGSGSGVRGSDRREALALREFLAGGARDVPICSLKGVFGEMAESHGPVAVAVALLSGKSGLVPPTTNFHAPLDGAEGLKISARSQASLGPAAVVTARSRFGVSAALVVES